MSPGEFLQYAAADALDPSTKGKIGALAQAKRAVTERADALLYASGLAKIAREKKWNYPDRLQRLEEIGFSTPANLQEWIIKPRNDLEHDYTYARTDIQLRDALSLATRYIANTDRYLASGIVRAAEFCTTPARAHGTKLLNPPPGHVVVVFDHDLGTLTAHLEGGVSIDRSTSKLGPDVMVAIFRALLEATLRDPTVIEPLPDEQAFLALL